MLFGRVFTTCPYLTGSPEGAVCNARSLLLRNLDNINPDMCMSRHFEVCRFYIEKLQEIDILNLSNKPGMGISRNKNVTMSS